MKTFDFYLTTKVTAWYDTPFSIQADTEEEARQKAIDFLDEAREMPWELVDETILPMTVAENNNEATEELHERDSVKVIWDNTNN